MPIVDEGTFETLRAAVDAPEEYSTGAERKELRAAFDIATFQIASRIFEVEAKNRMMLRRKLNRIANEDVAPNLRELLLALREALASCDPLQSKHYSDDEDETVEFINSTLKPLVDSIKAIDG